MAHHKRKGPKSTRSGCIHCKPHKHQAEKHRERSGGKRMWKKLASDIVETFGSKEKRDDA